MKKGKIIGLVVILLFLGGIGFGISQMMQDPEKYQEGGMVDVVFDVTDYYKISSEELLEKLGEPSGVYEYEKETNYTFNDGQIDFTVENNIVTKFKYFPSEPVKYNSQTDIIYMFGITPNKDTIQKVADTGLTQKFQSVTGENWETDIWEVEIHGINEENKTFDMFYVNY